MTANVKKQPYKFSFDQLVRRNGLNGRFRPVPKEATYYLTDMAFNVKNFFGMVKYSLFVTENEKMVAELDKNYVEANPTFGKCIIVIAFNRTRVFISKKYKFLPLLEACYNLRRWPQPKDRL